MESTTTQLCFTASISQIQPTDTYTASDPLRTPGCEKEFGCFGRTPFLTPEVDATVLVVVSATLATAHLVQHVVRRGKRAVVAMTEGVFEAVGLGGLRSR